MKARETKADTATTVEAAGTVEATVKATAKVTAGRRSAGAHRARRSPWFLRRWRFGRCSVYLEPRDVWVGVYVAVQAVYMCLLPMLVFKWDRVDKTGMG